MTLRTLFLDTASVAFALLDGDEVTARWDEPSALGGMTIGMLSAHLGRSVLVLDEYLDESVPDLAPVDAVGYYLGLPGIDDATSAVNQGVRGRSEAAAAAGPVAVRASISAALDRLRGRLPAAPADQRIAAVGFVLLLDDYVRTRLLEVVVHHDDLRVSLAGAGAAGADAAVSDLRRVGPDLPDAAYDEVLAILGAVSVARHGPLPLLRGLTRTERVNLADLRAL